MKIALTGASGGIGKSLMATLGASHEMTGIVRTPRGDDARYVGYGDKAALAATLAASDVVIHCALDAKAKGRDFLAVNHAMNREILSGALKGQCRI